MAERSIFFHFPLYLGGEPLPVHGGRANAFRAVPSSTIIRGDWKLIRIFHGGDNGAHRWKLYNLAEDIGERNDLSEKQPERVKAMDALIETCLADIHAVLPVPNPAFDPAQYHPELEGVASLKQLGGKRPAAGKKKPAGKQPAR